MTTVSLLTQPSCSMCDFAKHVLARVGMDHPLDIREIPLDSPTGRTLAAAHGVLFAPGILIDGELFSYGRLSEKKLRRHLEGTATRR